MKKYQKNDAQHYYYMRVSSFRTMETYRKVWNNLANYLREHWKLKDLEKIVAAIGKNDKLKCMQIDIQICIVGKRSRQEIHQA